LVETLDVQEKPVPAKVEKKAELQAKKAEEKAKQDAKAATEKKKRASVPVRILAEGGICVALAVALSYLKIPVALNFGGFGGSIDLVMIPLIIFAMRSNAGWGMGAGLVFGILKFFFANGTAVDWVSIVFDYGVAYAMVGLAGLFRKNYRLLPVAALTGCLARFAIHFLSGITVYAKYLPESFMGIEKPSLWLYSLLYNGTYMLPNTILAVVICSLLVVPPEQMGSPKAKK
jgi:thiamine transporter